MASKQLTFRKPDLFGVRLSDNPRIIIERRYEFYTQPPIHPAIYVLCLDGEEVGSSQRYNAVRREAVKLNQRPDIYLIKRPLIPPTRKMNR